MIFGRLIGWILFFAGVSVLAHDAILWRESGHWAPILFGQLWYDANPSSLNLAQAVIQRYLWPPLWDGAIVRLLLCWAFAVPMAAGALLVLLCRPWRRRALPAPVSPRPS
ncbi:MAG TPA: hypothetical protein VJ770_01335 [Stellaceae bacterium]|nr:hypothetical protein [Stellaceae bacterium]